VNTEGDDGDVSNIVEVGLGRVWSTVSGSNFSYVAAARQRHALASTSHPAALVRLITKVTSIAWTPTPLNYIQYC